MVKLTPDAPEEPPSAMRVIGAAHNFEYGPRAGDAGAFRARVHHASVPPRSERTHLKVAFFFRRSAYGERSQTWVEPSPKHHKSLPIGLGPSPHQPLSLTAVGQPSQAELRGDR